MNILSICFPIIIPVVFGLLIPVFDFKKKLAREIYVMTVVCVTSVLAWINVINMTPETITLWSFAKPLIVALRIDGVSKVFIALISSLWPFATLYAFEYMRHEERVNSFFGFYTTTFGITMGIASSANLMTMYMFYELLTLVTIPLVMHEMNHRSIRAAIKYFTYSIGGAAFAFMGFIIITKYCGTNDFVYGGIITSEIMKEKAGYVYLAYILMFFGFGVKAAVFPFHGWLPSAGVAPTPVTALLHAVAVVKSGAFAIIRVTYFIFGAETLRGTVGVYIPLAFVIITIVFGSSMAVKEQHLKRRFAYSTISNLSYILFGVLMLSPAGLTAGLLHMVFHGVMKIAIFFCAGAIMHQTGYEYIYEINGFGFKMKKIFAVYSLASLAVVGIPPLPGFYSKLALAKAALENGDVLSYIGIAALLISALLTAVYLMSIMVRAYFRPFESDKTVKDPNAYMVIPQFMFCAMMIGFSIFGSYICQFMAEIVSNL